MDHGSLTDNNGRQSDFRHVILIMTSNVGARDLSKRMPGLRRQRALRRHRRGLQADVLPEFRNRLDAKIDFAPLDPRTMDQIVDKFVRELGTQLAERKVTVTVTPAARTYLGKKGHDPMNGARRWAA
jgi:ATP-dependent Clp protease ATP-binding subunit ClpA